MFNIRSNSRSHTLPIGLNRLTRRLYICITKMFLNIMYKSEFHQSFQQQKKKKKEKNVRIIKILMQQKFWHHCIFLYWNCIQRNLQLILSASIATGHLPFTKQRVLIIASGFRALNQMHMILPVGKQLMINNERKQLINQSCTISHACTWYLVGS